MPKLGVNIDHIATLRQARREFDPDPVKAIAICEAAGANSIVAHLREDRRHINDKDVKAIRKAVQTRFNLEMAMNPEIIGIALKIKPEQATIVPERREEITTEGGLDVARNLKKAQETVKALHKGGIDVSLFIAPDKKQLDAAVFSGARIVEFHTGKYALAKTKAAWEKELKQLLDMTIYGRSLGLEINAGHGLKYDNTTPVARIPGMNELNIGHSIISYAVFVGLERAVKEMVKVIRNT
ncbi:MAG: pyridoxine 5'-phosphate synthase [Candidatus Omnitrophica bacterium]|nr:pyridoxine 5'-phosphate synthase [Candidatus Omnitrophota bacterium]